MPADPCWSPGGNANPGPVDIQGLVSSLGVTPLGIYDPRYNLGANWGDARGAAFPTCTFTGGAPTITGSGTTAQASFASTQRCAVFSAVTVPPTGISILFVGSIAAAATTGLASAFGDGTALWGIGSNTTDIIALTSKSGILSVVSAVAAGATIIAAASSAAYTGTGTIQVDAQTLVSGTTANYAPGTSGSMYVAASQVAMVVKGVVFLPGIVSPAQFGSFVTWATPNHTFTAQ